MVYEFTGKLTKVFDTQTFTSGFQKRSFVVSESASKYPNPIQFALTKEKCELIDEFKEGDELTVAFVLNGRAWESPKDGQTKYFCDLTAIKVNRAGEEDEKGGRGKKKKEAPPPAEPPAELAAADLDDATDIPF